MADFVVSGETKWRKPSKKALENSIEPISRMPSISRWNDFTVRFWTSKETCDLSGDDARTRKRGMAEHDLIFRELSTGLRSPQSRFRSREPDNSEQRANLGETMRPLLSVHYPSVMGPFYTMAVRRSTRLRSISFCESVREDNAVRAETACPVAARRGAECVNASSAHRRKTMVEAGRRTAKDRRKITGVSRMQGRVRGVSAAGAGEAKGGKRAREKWKAGKREPTKGRIEVHNKIA